MTLDDKNEIRQMFTDIMGTHTAQTDSKLEAINGKIDVINVKVNSIEIQTTKTNGRVTKLEDKVENIENKIALKIENIDDRIDVLRTNDVEHILHCPNVSKIQKLEEQQISRKSVINFLLLEIGVISTILGIALALFKLFGGNPSGT